MASFKFLSSPKRPERPHVPPSLLRSRNQGYFQQVKRSRHEVSHWPPSSDQVKNKSICTSAATPTCLHGVDRDDFIFYGTNKKLNYKTTHQWFELEVPPSSLRIKQTIATFRKRTAVFFRWFSIHISDVPRVTLLSKNYTTQSTALV